jgi:hypothetical protein
MEHAPDDAKSRAEAAETRLSLHLRDIERRVIQLDTECDDWRRRALAAEAALAEQASEFEAGRASLERERALLDQQRQQQAAQMQRAEGAPRDPQRTEAERPEPAPVRRPRGNWLR